MPRIPGRPPSDDVPAFVDLADGWRNRAITTTAPQRALDWSAQRRLGVDAWTPRWRRQLTGGAGR